MSRFVAPENERCRAILKWVWNWRCERRATHGELCRQHAKNGATVPAEWLHPINSLGVMLCEPLGPRRKIEPVSLPARQQTEEKPK